MPLVLLGLITRRWPMQWSPLQWIGGSLLTISVALPWYALAELRTPGFLGYFLVGENLQRFTDGAWKGDLYGSVHPHVVGYIWLLFLATALPWAPWLLWRVVRTGRAWITWRAIRDRSRDAARDQEWRLFLLLWMLTPALLFTPAGSVLATYLLPGVPAMALLAADFWLDRPAGPLAAPRKLRWFFAAAAVPALFVAVLPYLRNVISPDVSQGVLLSRANPAGGPLRVAYFPERPFSGEFYSAGRASEARDIAMLRQWVRERRMEYVVTRAGEELPADIRDALDRVASAGTRHATVLWAVRTSLPLAAAGAPAVSGEVRARP
jgi:4-amino-4-deoxy-L-arabinose transferase-like glycosyltransferase